MILHTHTIHAASARMEVPPGADPHDSRKGVIIGVTAFTLTVAFITVALRVYTRAVILRQFKLDDYTAVVAFLLIFACGFCVAYNTVNGLGTRVYFLDSATIERYLKTFYVSVIFYNASLMAVKMTFLFQYWRVLSLAVQRYRKVMIAATVIVFCWSVSQILLLMMVCIPIAAFWDRTVKGNCIPSYPTWYINGAGNIITDVIVLVLPLPIVGKLTLARGQKIILLGIFCLGFLTVSISVVRLKFLRLTEDFTWVNVEAAGWSIGELCCGITCACLATLRPLGTIVLSAFTARMPKKSPWLPHHVLASETSAGARTHETGHSLPHCNSQSSKSRNDLYGAASYEINSSQSMDRRQTSSRQDELAAA
ncbi:hypothetical protein B0T11DRAFT_289572 [Plectosphaerella cucumerina]|uniref:Rhodopsin domain-containing protein n=1 Tax=Plectosphaerella cucumerina TaxID=40658 RepID=A0A8K0WYN3_9PEZI|nr:hypothetical protein B0T11DRAFT_289572 [Plectosphaerella cucumerina]